MVIYLFTILFILIVYVVLILTMLHSKNNELKEYGVWLKNEIEKFDNLLNK